MDSAAHGFGDERAFEVLAGTLRVHPQVVVQRYQRDCACVGHTSQFI